MKKLIVFVLFSGFIFSSFSQSKYWIEFTDKGDLSQYNQATLLSEAAIANRLRQGIKLDYYDYPVNRDYLREISQLDIAPIHTSRWLNMVSARLTPDQILAVIQLPWVKEIHPVRSYQVRTGTAEECNGISDLDSPTRQLSMIGLDQLHLHQFTGKGITIAVFDNGYLKVDSLQGLKHLFEENRILATRDFVGGDNDVYAPCSHCKHGTYVLSILAAKMPGQLMGSAPDANYILLRTENDASETHQEEDNWVAAAEFADSMGAQIFTTSLGYFDFDPGQSDYRRSDLDGNTAIITIAADRAASRGIIVVNSAGNSSSRGLSAPADGDSVIAVGAVDQCADYSSFSSQGPSFDGRIKPDVAAMGEASFFLLPTGQIARGNGTSFSCPVISGLAACMLQAAPETSNMQFYDALIRSASQYDQPDKYLGYGIPNGPAAYTLLTGRELDVRFYQNPFEKKNLVIFPNPSTGTFRIALTPDVVEMNAQIDILDASGRKIFTKQKTLTRRQNQLNVPTDFPSGLYAVRIRDRDNSSVFYIEKVVIMRN